MCFIVTFCTWFPKTPIAHAEETWCDGNQVAANCAGMPKMKICEMATTVCPANMAGKWSWFVAKTLIHDPRHVPRDPRSTERRSPWKRFKESNHLIKKRQHECLKFLARLPNFLVSFDLNRVRYAKERTAMRQPWFVLNSYNSRLRWPTLVNRPLRRG